MRTLPLMLLLLLSTPEGNISPSMEMVLKSVAYIEILRLRKNALVSVSVLLSASIGEPRYKPPLMTMSPLSKAASPAWIPAPLVTAISLYLPYIVILLPYSLPSTVMVLCCVS